MIQIIKEDALNVRREEFVFEAACKWISYDEKTRCAFIFRILSNIRMGRMRPYFIAYRLKRHKYVRAAARKCRSFIGQTLVHLIFDCNGVPNCALLRRRLPNEILLAIGGFHHEDASRIESYDPRNDAWTTVGTTGYVPTLYSGVATLGDKIYAIGGTTDELTMLNAVRRYDLSRHEWTEVAPMHVRRGYVAVAVLDGYIYAIGGKENESSRSRLKTVERYDPRSNQWTAMSPMRYPRSDASACVLGDSHLVVAGGFDGEDASNTCEMFDPKLNQWKDLPSLTSERSGAGCVSYRGSVYVVGGTKDAESRLKSVERWSPGMSKWRTCPSMSEPRCNMGVSIIDDKLFAIGGYDGSNITALVECYDLETGSWSRVKNIRSPRSGFGVAICPYFALDALEKPIGSEENLK
jgi:hypothetical protein